MSTAGAEKQVSYSKGSAIIVITAIQSHWQGDRCSQKKGITNPTACKSQTSWAASKSAIAVVQVGGNTSVSGTRGVHVCYCWPYLLNWRCSHA